MQQQADEDELGLSSAALAALKEFALENNMLGPEGGDDDVVDVRLQVQERMDVKERTHEFSFTFGDDGDDEQVCIALAGVNPELGQTLASTGLTVWRAAQEMARFMWEHRRWFAGKRVVELGAGLGLCGVLASKLCIGGTVVITDGGEEFTDSAMDALRANLVKNSCNLLAQSPARNGSNAAVGGRDATAAAAAAAAAAESEARVALEKLTWGEHEAFLGRNGGGSDRTTDGVNDGDHQEGRGGFDFVVAADVIYEEEGVSPLLRTVVDILRLRAGERSDSKHPDHCPSPSPAAAAPKNENEEQDPPQPESPGPAPSSCLRRQASSPSAPPCLSPAPTESTFLLAFARRNISIERVLGEAESLGLAWRVPDDFEPASASENIYLMSLR
ncbi:conserved unknown protein [Ectocarpus siliculosus]|uniref:Uncharacterized protein n=1 Tax=Ectocarpus siliculosus TaxID=2880 RepID=D8LKR9_ECTSI|nr:conserved unknown protein [Ectocarpus siliculosus]|eukprot:CBN76104.1 conserved unknown protein [Ectocarpus siliculosus]